jgi:hypothetical protein
MIPTISDMLYRLHHEKPEMLTRAEKRRAVLLLSGIMLCITIIVMLWILK